MCELKGPGTGNWLKALPTFSRFSIPRDEFRTVMAMHMLLPHPLIMNLLGLRKEQWHGCLCQLGEDRILSEDHLAGCRFGRHIVKRHNDVVMQLTEVALEHLLGLNTHPSRSLNGDGLKITTRWHPKVILPPLAVCSRHRLDQWLSLTHFVTDLNAASNGDVDDNFPVAISRSKHEVRPTLAISVQKTAPFPNHRRA